MEHIAVCTELSIKQNTKEDLFESPYWWNDFHDNEVEKADCKRPSIIRCHSCKKDGDMKKYTCIYPVVNKEKRKDKPETKETSYPERWEEWDQ